MLICYAQHQGAIGEIDAELLFWMKLNGEPLGVRYVVSGGDPMSIEKAKTRTMSCIAGSAARSIAPFERSFISFVSLRGWRGLREVTRSAHLGDVGNRRDLPRSHPFRGPSLLPTHFGGRIRRVRGPENARGWRVSPRG